MLVNGVHGDQRDFPRLAGLHLCGVRRLSCRCAACLSAVLGNDGNARICNLAAQALALDGSNRSFYAVLAHHVGVLGHGAEQITVVDQVHDCVGLVKAHADDVGVAGSLDGVAGAGGGTLVTAEDAHNALGDIVLRDGLGLGRVAFAVLGFHQLVALALKCGAEAFFALHGGVGGCVYVYDADLAGGDARCFQSFDHFLASGLARRLVVGGEGGFRVHVGRGVHIDQLHASAYRFFQGGGDGVGSVCGHHDGLIPTCNGVVHALNLLSVVLGIGGHEGHGDA